MNKISINMPQMDFCGLSENWLLKKAGNYHWQEIFEKANLKSKNLVNDYGKRMYPAFIAIKCKYNSPLNKVKENDNINLKINLKQYGNVFFNSNITFYNKKISLKLEMLTAFVVRENEYFNDFIKEKSNFFHNFESLKHPPKLLNINKRIRLNKIDRYNLSGYLFKKKVIRNKNKMDFEPSPYTDFNGARMLYFAAYPTISEIITRNIINKKKIFNLKNDWALLTSTIKRDIFYYGNLNLGDKLTVVINDINKKKKRFFIHTILLNKSKKKIIAEIFTIKQLIQ